MVKGYIPKRNKERGLGNKRGGYDKPCYRFQFMT